MNGVIAQVNERYKEEEWARKPLAQSSKNNNGGQSTTPIVSQVSEIVNYLTVAPDVKITTELFYGKVPYDANVWAVKRKYGASVGDVLSRVVGFCRASTKLYCNASVERIANEIGMSRWTCSSCLNTLVAEGLLIKEVSSDSSGKSKVYRLPIDFQARMIQLNNDYPIKEMITRVCERGM